MQAQRHSNLNRATAFLQTTAHNAAFAEKEGWEWGATTIPYSTETLSKRSNGGDMKRG